MDVLLLLALSLGAALVYGIFSILNRPTVAPPTVIIEEGEADADETPAEDEGKVKLTVLYGTQMGTAEGFAKVLARESRRHGFVGKAIDLEEYECENLAKEDCVMFTVATYGEGDPTDDAIMFQQWLAKQEAGAFAGVKFAVFGLGNRQYEHFNAQGKLVDKRLEECGATRAYELGLGDDSGKIEDQFMEWQEGLWPAMRIAADIKGEEAPRSSSDLPLLPDKDFVVNFIATPADPTVPEFDPRHIDVVSRPYFTSKPAKVVANYELLQKPVDRSTIHVELDLRGSGITYQTADNADVCAENDPAVVESLAKWLGYDLDRWFTLEPVNTSEAMSGGGGGGGGGGAGKGGSSAHVPFPTPCSVRTALARYCDLQGAPRKSLLGMLAHFAGQGTERTELVRLSSREGSEDFEKWVVAEERSIWELFQKFPSIKIPLDSFFSIIPRLVARPYTICSSSTVNPDRMHLVVAVVDTPKPGPDRRRRLKGVASTHMRDTKVPATVGGKRVDPVAPGALRSPWPTLRVVVQESSFRLPKPSVPIIMVGPGTGVAPMRAFLQERRHQRESGATVGDTVLFFGCRRPDEDYIYQDEIEDYQKDGTLTKLFLAFSRAGPKKVYVQNLIKEHGELVWGLIEAGAYFYVCGASAMGRDVRHALENLATTVGGMSDAECKDYMSKFESDKRYVQELWS